MINAPIVEIDNIGPNSEKFISYPNEEPNIPMIIVAIIPIGIIFSTSITQIYFLFTMPSTVLPNSQLFNQTSTPFLEFGSTQNYLLLVENITSPNLLRSTASSMPLLIR